MPTLRKIAVIFGILAGWGLQHFSVTTGIPARAAGPGGRARGGGNAGIPDRQPRTLGPYFSPVTSAPKAPDAEGFLQRWLLLEPINQSIRSNAVFTESYVRNAIQVQHFPDQFTAVPRNGAKVTVAGQELAWHALDSSQYNVKLFRLAYGLNKPAYSVLFFAVTAVDSPREVQNVRLAVGSNSASIWWLNGQEAVGLFGDRRMVADDCVSKRLTLKQGTNVIHGAVINGPGMSDFCVRFVDENGDPIKELTTQLENASN